MLSLPELLIAFRAGCAPLIFVLACFGFPGWLLALVLGAAFLSDVLDGAIARRLGLATAALRRADTLVDTFFYVAAGAALKAAVPHAFDNAELALVLLVIAHVSRGTFELTKFGRLSAYHMYSSKLLGVLLLIALVQGFLTGEPGAILPLALWFGVANEIEGFVISTLLPSWRPDVPSILHALQSAQRKTA